MNIVFLIITTISDNYIALIRDYFKDKPVLKACIFGSFARGDGDTDSDIDILVELDYSERIGLMYFQMQLELQSLLKREIDFVSDKARLNHILDAIMAIERYVEDLLSTHQ